MAVTIPAGRLVWDELGKRFFETGINETVLFLQNSDSTYDNGVPWSGVTNFSENPSGGEMTPLYADNIKYLNLQASEDFGGNLQAYCYPEEFAECDGSAEVATGITIAQQPRKGFGLVYKTKIGNDVAGDALGYKIHCIYGCHAAPSQKARNTINNSPEATQFSWDISTVPVNVKGYKPTAHLVIDSRTCDPDKLKELERNLFGGDRLEAEDPDNKTGLVIEASNAKLLLPDEIIKLIGAKALG